MLEVCTEDQETKMLLVTTWVRVTMVELQR